MTKITNSDWAVDASTITDSERFYEIAVTLIDNPVKYNFKYGRDYYFISSGYWALDKGIVNRKIITYTQFIEMFDNQKPNNIMDTYLMASLRLAVEAAKIVYPDCVIKIEVSNLPIHEIGHAMNESNVKTQEFKNELPFDEVPHGTNNNKLIQLDATPEIKLISKPIK